MFYSACVCIDSLSYLEQAGISGQKVSHFLSTASSWGLRSWACVEAKQKTGYFSGKTGAVPLS